jgi:hypothetical protein
MAMVLDILTLEPASCPKFTVDIEAEYVATSMVNAYLINASSKRIFQAGDNFTILSFGILIPGAFSMVVDLNESIANTMELKLVKEDATSTYNILPLSTYSTIFIPLDNFENVINTFVDLKRNLAYAGGADVPFSGNFKLDLSILAYISMLGIPASLDGKIISVAPFVKILHNLPMIAGEAEPEADFSFSNGVATWPPTTGFNNFENTFEITDLSEGADSYLYEVFAIREGEPVLIDSSTDAEPTFTIRYMGDGDHYIIRQTINGGEDFLDSDVFTLLPPM